MLALVALCASGPSIAASQTTDSLAAARRVVAAASIAAKEYALGVPPEGGRVTEPGEVEESILFLDQARYDVPLLPHDVRPFADSGLTALRALFMRKAPPTEAQSLATAISRRLAAAVGGAEGLVPVPTRPPSLARGAAVYQVQCAACHGETGHGDGPKAKNLTGPPPTSLADPKVMAGISTVDMYRKILLGVAGTAMPQFEEALSDEDRWAVTAYVAALPYGGSASAVVFANVRRQLDSAVQQRSEKLAFDAYLTFEQVETDIRAKNPGLANELEGRFAALRQRAAAGADDAELRGLHAGLLSALERGERLVADRSSGASLLAQSFLLLVREGFEAILIVAALMAFCTKAGADDRRREVAWGAWAAVGASLVSAVILELMFEITPSQRELLEGVTMLVAVAVLFYVSYWLLSKVEADKWSAFLKGKVEAAITSGSGFALASVAFLAVYREGVETILFYKALAASGGSGGIGALFAGIALGALALVILYVLIMRLGMRIALRPFFAVTGALLYYMAFVFAGKGIAELQEGNVIGTTVIEWAPRVPLLGIYPTVQSLVPQGVLLLLALAALGRAVLQRRAA